MNPRRNLPPRSISFPSSDLFSISLKEHTETPYSHQIPTLTLFLPDLKESLALRMDQTKHPSVTNRSYEDFDPVWKWRREESRDTLEVHLPGFKREHIKVQVNHLGFMVISGECPIIDGAKWRRFKKEIEIPSNYNEDAIRATFMPSILTVVMPKKSSLISQRGQEKQIPEFEPRKSKEKESLAEENQTTEFKGMHTREDTNTKGDEKVEEDIEGEEEEIEGNSGELTPETTREVCFKILVVVTMILVIGSYVIDTCKSIMADS